MQRKIAAIMAADVAGYSRLVAVDEDGTLRQLLSCRAIFDDFIGRVGGRVFNTAGDAILAECPSAVDAVRAAMDIQESVRTLNMAISPDCQMLFRIGLTVGDVVEREGDLLGDGVNIAARLQTLAEPGGICVSRNLFEQVVNKVDAHFRDIGPQTVKNLPTPIHAFVLSEEASSPDVALSPGRRNSPIWLGGFGLAVLLAAGSAMAFQRWHESPSQQIFGFVAQPVATKDSGDMPLDPERIPFVCGDCRPQIAAAVSNGANSAVALSDTGAYGYAAERPTVDDAQAAALKNCAENRIGDGVCRAYAINGLVVWPRRLSLPPHPWVDPAVKETTFDATKIGGVWAAHFAASFGPIYADGLKHKAVALDGDGHWYWRSHLDSVQRAEQTVLELCANRADTLCRLVAIDNHIVVAPSTGPVSVPQQ